MVLRDKSMIKMRKLIKSFTYAFEGIVHAFRREQNFQIHTLSSVMVILLGAFLEITKIDWIILFMLIGGMLCLELINTAIERVVDLVSPDFHPLAKAAKDTSAGAVFVFAITSIIVGLFIFCPYIYDLL